MSTTNKNCNSCDYCYYCYYCNYCYYCYYCNSCNSCNSCTSCYYCNSCTSCNFCNSCNSCYYSRGLRMSEKMIFCLGEGKYETKGEGYQKNNRIFNKDVTNEEYERVRSLLTTKEIKIYPTKWIDKKDMTQEEKDSRSSWEQTGGYLKTFSYEDAWANFWSEASKEQKDVILTLPQFDKDIFKGITGIDVEVEDDKMQEAMELLKKNGYKVIKE